MFSHLPVQIQNYPTGIISEGIGVVLSQWAGINQHKSTEICVDTVIYTQVCITAYQGSKRTKAAVVHEWFQKQTIEVMGIYQKFAPNKGMWNQNPIHQNLAQL